MSYEFILFEQRGRVGVITMNRPDKLNAWTKEMHFEVRDAWGRCNADRSIGAIVLTGAGRAFCAGADMGGFKARRDAVDAGAEPERSVALSGPGGWVPFVYAHEKPTIAAVNGVAVGIGITQTLCMDIRIASEEARVGMFFAKMGLSPELASSHLLSHFVGSGRALEWSFTARLVGAQEAKDAGLFTEVVPGGRLLDRAVELGEQLASLPPTSLSLIRNLFRDNLCERDPLVATEREAVANETARASWDHGEAIAAFLEKRPPDFSKRP